METQSIAALDIPTLTTFFMWCTILSIGLMLFWVLMWFLVPDLIYKMQSKFFPMPKETWTLAFYCFLGMYKLMVSVCFIIPWVALLIMG